MPGNSSVASLDSLSIKMAYTYDVTRRLVLRGSLINFIVSSYGMATLHRFLMPTSMRLGNRGMVATFTACGIASVALSLRRHSFNASFSSLLSLLGLKTIFTTGADTTLTLPPQPTKVQRAIAHVMLIERPQDRDPTFFSGLTLYRTMFLNGVMKDLDARQKYAEAFETLTSSQTLENNFSHRKTLLWDKATWNYAPDPYRGFETPSVRYVDKVPEFCSNDAKFLLALGNGNHESQEQCNFYVFVSQPTGYAEMGEDGYGDSYNIREPNTVAINQAVNRVTGNNDNVDYYNQTCFSSVRQNFVQLNAAGVANNRFYV